MWCEVTGGPVKGLIIYNIIYFTSTVVTTTEIKREKKKRGIKMAVDDSTL